MAIAGELKELTKILKGRKSPETFNWFVDKMCSITAGCDNYKRASKDKVHEWLTVSSETFAMLVFENFYPTATSAALLAKEKEQAPSEDEEETPEGQEKDDKDNKNKPLGATHTFAGKGARKNQGWTQDGIKQHNELYRIIAEDRAQRPRVDDHHLQIKRMEALGGRSKKRKAKEDPMQGWEAPVDDMSVGGDDDDDLVPGGAATEVSEERDGGRLAGGDSHSGPSVEHT